MSTKTKASAVETLQAELARIQREIAALTQEEYSVSEAAVRRFTADHFKALRMTMVIHDGQNQPVKAKGRNAWALKKNADAKLYYNLKGLEGTLRSREIAKAKGEDVKVELSSTLNDKGRSQIMFAQEVLQSCIDGGWLGSDSPLLRNEPAKKVGRPRKQA